MLKKILLITTALFAVAGVQSQALAEPPAPLNSQQAVTQEEINALTALQNALAAAVTPEERSQIISDAIAKTPTLASKPQLSGSVQASALQAGMSIAQLDTAIVTGLAQSQSPAAGGASAGNPTFSLPPLPSFTSSGGSSTSTSTASQATNGG